MAPGTTVVRHDIHLSRVWSAQLYRAIVDTGTVLHLAYWPGIRSLAPTTWASALRTAISHYKSGAFGPIGGLPGAVRIDRSKDLLEGPTPLEGPKRGQLWSFTLEDHGRARTLTSSGVYWRGRYYVGDWMQGLTGDGIKVRIRFLPHHSHEIKIVDAVTAARLGAATSEQRAAVRRTRSAEQRQLKKALAAAEKLCAKRYAAVTTPRTPESLQTLTAAQAAAELEAADSQDLQALALPGLIPHGPVPDGWVIPRATTSAEAEHADGGRADPAPLA